MWPRLQYEHLIDKADMGAQFEIVRMDREIIVLGDRHFQRLAQLLKRGFDCIRFGRVF